jgi:hypothetical protein
MPKVKKSAELITPLTIKKYQLYCYFDQSMNILQESIKLLHQTMKSSKVILLLNW